MDYIYMDYIDNVLFFFWNASSFWNDVSFYDDDDDDDPLLTLLKVNKSPISL